jgi:hypothetical protein
MNNLKVSLHRRGFFLRAKMSDLMTLRGDDVYLWEIGAWNPSLWNAILPYALKEFYNVQAQ